MKTQRRSGSGRRHHALDGLRATMMLLGLLLHASLSYGRLPYGSAWPYKDESTLAVFDALVIVIHVFRMPLFYLLAGFFAASLLDRRGAWGLACNRARRVALPLLAGWIVLIPVIRLGFAFAQGSRSGSMQDAFEAVGATLSSRALYDGTTAHLWFLYDLVFFYLATLLALPVLRRLPGRWRRSLLASAVGLLGQRWRAPLLAAATTPLLLFMPSGVLDTSMSLVPDPKLLLTYGIFYAAGLGFGLDRRLPATLERDLRPQLLLALALAPINFATVDQPGWKVVTATTGALMTWLFVFAITGLFLRFQKRASALMRYLSDASYWIYLIHFPLLVWIAGVLAPFSWNAAAKFLVLMTMAVPLLWVSYELAGKSPIVRWLLGGQRRGSRRSHPRAAVRSPRETAARTESIPALEPDSSVLRRGLQGWTARPFSSTSSEATPDANRKR